MIWALLKVKRHLRLLMLKNRANKIKFTAFDSVWLALAEKGAEWKVI